MADRSDKGCLRVALGACLTLFGCCGSGLILIAAMMAEHPDPKTGRIVGAGFQSYQIVPLLVAGAALLVGLLLLLPGLRTNRE